MAMLLRADLRWLGDDLQTTIPAVWSSGPDRIGEAGPGGVGRACSETGHN